jgi:hypothetical protein
MGGAWLQVSVRIFRLRGKLKEEGLRRLPKGDQKVHIILYHKYFFWAFSPMRNSLLVTNYRLRVFYPSKLRTKHWTLSIKHLNKSCQFECFAWCVDVVFPNESAKCIENGPGS